MIALKIFNFFKGKRKDDENFYEYGMTHQEAVVHLLKKTGNALSTLEIMAALKDLKLRRGVRNINSLTSTLFRMKYNGKITYNSLDGEWSI